MRRPASGGWTLPAAALVTLVLVETLRVWFPSILFIVGRVGETPATVMGAFALACLAGGLVAAATLPRLRADHWWAAGVAALLVGRGGLQAVSGGPPQAVLSTVGVVGGVVALTALAAAALDGHEARTGVLAGLAAAVAVHAGLATRDLVWRDGGGVVLAVTVLLAATAVAAWRVARGWDVSRPPTEAGREGSSPGPAWPWLLFAPTLLLLGVITGVPGRAATATGWSNGAIGAALALGHGLGVAVAVAGTRLGPGATGTVGAALVAVGTAIALRPTGPRALAAQLAIVIGIGAVLAATSRAAGASAPRRRATAAAAAVLLFGVGAFVYYAAYDLVLPFPNRVVLLVAALAAASVGLVAAYVGAGARPSLRGTRAGAAVALGSLALAALVWVATPAVTTVSPARDEPGTPFRVTLYNLQMGFDVEGRFAVDAQAEVLAAESPDLVVLNEVDRGWLTTGGHDTLRLLADRLDLPHVFAPAADEVWGNALLSRYPVRELGIERLPRGRDPMPRSQFAAVVEVAEGEAVAVVGTHLSHVDVRGDTRLPQARAVAATVAGLRERDLPTVVLGDLNAELDSPELATFQHFVTSALPPTPTWPSWDPEVHIDHILVSDDLLARDAVVRRTLASDHLPVAVTLEIAGE